MRPMIGMMMSVTSESTILPKAAPMITPMARSTTLPRNANFLNSWSMCISPSAYAKPDQQSRNRHHRKGGRKQNRGGVLLDLDTELLGEHERIGRGRQRGHHQRRLSSNRFEVDEPRQHHSREQRLHQELDQRREACLGQSVTHRRA